MEKSAILPIVEAIIRKHDTLAYSISDESINLQYEDAYHAYQNGSFGKSIRLFECICFHRPYEPIYWEGLASAQFMQKEYENSIRSWAMVCLLDPKCAKGHLYAAECYFSLNNPADGLKALKEARKRAEEKPLIDRIDLLKEIWGEKL